MARLARHASITLPSTGLRVLELVKGTPLNPQSLAADTELTLEHVNTMVATPYEDEGDDNALPWPPK